MGRSLARYGSRFIPSRQSPDIEIDIQVKRPVNRMEMDSKPESLDLLDRQLMQWRMEREALKKETDSAAKTRLKDINTHIESAQEEYASGESMVVRKRSSANHPAARKVRLGKKPIGTGCS